MARSLPILSDDDEPSTDASVAPPRPSRVSLADSTVSALEESGPIARGLSSQSASYETREGQLSMARAVASAIEDERVLLCEAGTGTGKTLAYLVPAILSGRRVVVSTATKALQEQIFTKDLPMLDAHLGVRVQAALMKGLSNYLCLRRLDEARKAQSIGLGARDGAVFASGGGSMLGRIEGWAAESETGDRAELDTMRDDDPTWHDVQSGSDTRIGQGCTFYDRCFVTKMRDAAQRARLVVVNHHLYLADLALRRGGARQGVIPDHDVVIFDEAHQLEDIATEFFGVRASSSRVEAIVRDARRTLSAAGALAAGRAQLVLDSVSTTSKAFFAAIAVAGGGLGEGRAPMRDDAWGDEAVDRLHRLDAALEALAGFTKTRDGGDPEAREEVTAVGRRAMSMRDDLVHVSSPARGEVAWIEVRARSCSIGVSPIDLAPVFRTELFGAQGNRPHTIVLTSATLATGQASAQATPFEHAKRRLGISAPPPPPRDPDDESPAEPRARDSVTPIELVVPSPFDFARKAGVYVPLDLPEPNDPTFLARAGVRVLELVRASRGGAFVLCASTKNMRALHAFLREERVPYPLFCQGEAPKIALLNGFRAAGNGVLVATMGFWEGVDVPGRSLRLVVIDKLPFAVPTDPVVAARHRAIEETGRSSFADLSLPEAAISLKQGFGRLIRTRDDAGVVAILDKRIRTKGYGRTLRAALPPAAPLHTIDDVRGFFEVVVGVGAPQGEDAVVT